MKRVATLYLVLLLFTLNACDFEQQDYAPEPVIDLDPGVKTVTTRPQSILLINILQDINFNQPVKLSFTQMPSRGQAQFIDLGLIQYQTDDTFISGQDQFSYQIASASNQILMQDTVLINMAGESDTLSCGAYYDYQKTETDKEVVIDVLANDVLCSETMDSVVLKISKSPTNGSAVIKNNQVVYLPSPGFIGLDPLIYEICPGDLEGDCYYATVDLEVISSGCEIDLVPDSIHYYYNFSDTIKYNLLANDLICDSINVTLELENVPAGNMAYISNQQLMYYPEQTDFEMIQFNYKVCNQNHPCHSEVIIITFADSTEAAACEVKLQDDIYDLRSDSSMQASYDLQILSNDLICSDEYILQIPKSPAAGNVIIHSNYLEFKPEENQAGKVVFNYQLCLDNFCYTGEITIIL